MLGQGSAFQQYCTDLNIQGELKGKFQPFNRNSLLVFFVFSQSLTPFLQNEFPATPLKPPVLHCVASLRHQNN